MRRTPLCGLAVMLLFVGACRTEGIGERRDFRSNANEALIDDPYAAASK